MQNTKNKNKYTIHDAMVRFYWKTFGKRKINKIVRDALNESQIDMDETIVGELRKDGGFYDNKRVL
jgi:hypothetical protein